MVPGDRNERRGGIVIHKHLLRGQAPPGKGRPTGNAPTPKAARLDTSGAGVAAHTDPCRGHAGNRLAGLERDGMASREHPELPAHRAARRAPAPMAGRSACGRSALRELCVLVLLLPTLVGQSPRPRLRHGCIGSRRPVAPTVGLPLDVLTRTEVVDEFGRAGAAPSSSWVTTGRSIPLRCWSAGVGRSGARTEGRPPDLVTGALRELHPETTRR